MEFDSRAPHRVFAAWVTAAAALLVAGSCLDLPFLSEDWAWVARAHERAQASGFWGALTASAVAADGPGFYRPLFEVMNTIDYALWGLDPRGYHLTNGLLLVAAALLLRSVAHRMLGRTAAAEVAALAFVASPLVGESAFMAVGRDTLLPIVLTLTAVRLALSERRSVRAVGVPVAGTLACFAKEWALLVVPVAVVLARASASARDRGRGRTLRSTALEAWPLAVGCAAYLAIRAAVLGRWIGGYQAVLVPPDFLRQRLEQIAMLLFPLPTSGLGEAVGWIAPAVVLIALVAGLRSGAPAARRCAVVAAGWILAVNVAHVPVRVGRIQLEDARYVYPAVPPLCLLLAAATSALRPLARGVALTAWLAVCAVGLTGSIADWRSAGRAMHVLRTALTEAVKGGDIDAVEVLGVPLTMGSARFGFGIQEAFQPPFVEPGAVPVHVTGDLWIPHRGLRRSPEVLGLWQWAFGERCAGVLRLLWDRCRSTLGSPFSGSVDARPPPRARIEVVGSGTIARVVLRGSPGAAYLLFAGPRSEPVPIGPFGVARVACPSPVRSGLLDDHGRAELGAIERPLGVAMQAVFLAEDGDVELSACVGP